MKKLSKWPSQWLYSGLFLILSGILNISHIKAAEEAVPENTLHYNEIIVIDSEKWGKRLWTAETHRDIYQFNGDVGNWQSGKSKNRSYHTQPYDHIEILIGSHDQDMRLKNGPQFFLFRNPHNPYDKGPIRFGRDIEIVSLYCTNHKIFPNGGRNWWRHEGSRWFTTNNLENSPYGEIVVSKTYPLAEGHPNATGPSRLFRLESPEGKQGFVPLNEAIEIWWGQEKLWVNPDSRWGTGHFELLTSTATNDKWGEEHEGDSRSNLWQKFIIRKEVAAEGQANYDAIQTMLNEWMEKKELPVKFDKDAFKAKRDARQQERGDLAKENETLRARVAELEQKIATTQKKKTTKKKGKKRRARKGKKAKGKKGSKKRKRKKANKKKNKKNQKGKKGKKKANKSNRKKNKKKKANKKHNKKKTRKKLNN